MGRGRALRAAALASAAVVFLAGPWPAWAQSAPLPGVEVLWSKQQADRFDQGVALSPDGRWVAYVGTTDDPEVLGPLLRRRVCDPQTGYLEKDAPQPMQALILKDLQTGRETALVVAGGPYTLLAQPGFSRDEIRQPNFSPDGKRIVFTGSTGVTNYSSDIYTVHTEWKTPIQLTYSSPTSDAMARAMEKQTYKRNYSAPRYSPDGSRLLLAIYERAKEPPARRDPETGELLGGRGDDKFLVGIMKPDGSQLEILAAGGYCFPYFWSADGQSVYYGSNCEEQSGLIRMNLKTRTAETVMKDLPGRVFGWAAEREWVAFRLQDGPIAWYDLASGRPIFVGYWSVPVLENVRGEWLELDHFDWSASGRVALTRKDPNWSEARLGRIEVVRFGASEPITFSSVPPVDLPDPLWSKRQPLGGFRQFVGYGETASLSEDGKTLVFLGADGDLNIVGIDAGHERTLLLSDAAEGKRIFEHPSISPDGKRIVFTMRHNRMWAPADIFVVDADDGHAEQLTVSPELPETKRKPGGAHYARFYYRPAFSPDGQKILLDIHDSTQLESSLVAVMEADGGEMRVVAKGDELFWAADGKSLFYTPGGRELVKLNVATGEERTFAGLPPYFLAKHAERDWVLVPETAGQWVDLSGERVTPGDGWKLPMAITVEGAPMKLEHAWWSKACRVLLQYVGKDEELYKVIHLDEPRCRRQ